MQALESLRAAVSGARAAVSGAAGRLHSLPIIGHLTAHDDTRHDVPHFPETGYVGGNAICAAAGKRVEDYLSKRTTKAFLRALVKDDTVASEEDLIHEHGAEGPFMHPKLALHMAQWCNPSFASVVNGWVLRYIAADRTLAEDIVRRAEGGGGGMATLGSSLTHTLQEVPMLPNSQPQGGAEAEAEAPLPLPEATASAAAAAEAPAAKAPAKAPQQRKAPQRKAPPAAEEEGAPMVEAEESEPSESEEEAAPTPVKTPKTRQPRRARVGIKSTPRAKAKAGRVAKAAGGRRRRGAAQESYKIHMHRVLKQVHPDMSISAKGMEVLNNMVVDMFESLATEAATLLHKDKNSTLTAREVAAAVKLRFDGDLRAHAMSEGAKAVARFNSSAKQ